MGQLITHCSCWFSGRRVLPCSRAGSLPRGALHELLEHESILHMQQFSMNCSSVGHSSKGCNPSGKACSNVGSPQRVTGPTRKPALVWAPLSTGRSLPGACSSTGLPPVHSLFQVSTHSSEGFLCGLQVDLCIPVDLHSCFTMVFTNSCFTSAPKHLVPLLFHWS